MDHKPLHWIGSSVDDLRACPKEVRYEVGYALWIAQQGGSHANVKRMKRFGGVLEVVSNHESGTYRTVYTVRFERAIYVLHVFQKKSKSGIATPPREIARIEQRLKTAREDYAARYPEE